jgi:comEA protein
MDKQEGLNIGVLIEKHRLPIGVILLLLVVAGLVVLLLKSNQTTNGDKRIEALEVKISQLENEIKKTKTENESTEAEKNVPNQTEKTIAEPVVSQNEANDTDVRVLGTATSSKTESVKPSGVINLNAATVTELDSLPGIGPTYAERIVEYRNSNGGFKSVDEVKQVKGIGDKTFEKFKDMITVN